jgi:two-component system, OmpR family, sensor kinase
VGPARWANVRSLRVQILAVLVGLLALTFVFVGTTTVFTLNHYMVKQLDDRLDKAGQRFMGHPPAGPGNQNNRTGQVPTTQSCESTGSNQNSPGPQVAQDPLGLFKAIQEPGTIAAETVNGKIVCTAKMLTGEGAADVPTSLNAILAALPADGKPRTRDLGSLGSYRLVANPTGHEGANPNGYGEANGGGTTTGTGTSSTVLITGLPLTAVDTARKTLIGIELAVGLIAMVIATFGGAAIIRVALAPLTRVASTARRVSEQTLHEGEVEPLDRVPDEDTDPRSEVGQVGAALNRMLGHIGSALAARQASETQLRQFVADASHELRTPLAAIRGYTELTQRHRMATPPPVTDALDRVDAAARRMTALVEDLLLLARLDAKRPLAAEPVDLTAMVIEAVTDAHVAGPEHRWRLDLPEESVSVIGDTARLHQVLANLLANARTHTPTGTTVTVGLVVTSGHVAMRVTDDGPGIPPQLLPRLFERFARGDSSRSRKAGSTGLGLAIVDAVVAAHGGSVDVSSVPGETAFIVWLPFDGNSQLASRSGIQSGQQKDTFLPV